MKSTATAAACLRVAWVEWTCKSLSKEVSNLSQTIGTIFDIGLGLVLCALHSTDLKDAEQDPLFRATPRAPHMRGSFFSGDVVFFIAPRCFFHRLHRFHRLSKPFFMLHCRGSGVPMLQHLRLSLPKGTRRWSTTVCRNALQTLRSVPQVSGPRIHHANYRVSYTTQ